MANVPNLQLVPCVVTVDLTPFNSPISATLVRTPTAQPFFGGSSSGTTIPTGPQRWPL